jgi:hypothetical protein
VHRLILLLLDDAGLGQECLLQPDPVGGAGHRLWEALRAVRPDFTSDEYRSRFEPRTLLQYPARVGQRRMALLRLVSGLGGRPLVVIGTAMRDAAGLTRALPCEPVHTQHGDMVWLPFPSGRNRWWSVEVNRVGAALYLLGALEGLE